MLLREQEKPAGLQGSPTGQALLVRRRAPWLDFIVNHTKNKKLLQQSAEKLKEFIFNFTGEYLASHQLRGSSKSQLGKRQVLGPYSLSVKYKALLRPHADTSAWIYCFCSALRTGFTSGALGPLQKQHCSPE